MAKTPNGGGASLARGLCREPSRGVRLACAKLQISSFASFVEYNIANPHPGASFVRPIRAMCFAMPPPGFAPVSPTAYPRVQVVPRPSHVCCCRTPCFPCISSGTCAIRREGRRGRSSQALAAWALMGGPRPRGHTIHLPLLGGPLWPAQDMTAGARSLPAGCDRPICASPLPWLARRGVAAGTWEVAASHVGHGAKPCVGRRVLSCVLRSGARSLVEKMQSMLIVRGLSAD